MRIFYTMIFLLSFVSIKAQTPFVCKGQYFLSLSQGLNSDSGLFEVVLNGSKVNFKTVSDNIGGNINAIGYRSTDNFIYGVDPDDFLLYKLGQDGVVKNLGRLREIPENSKYFAGDVSPDGEYLILMGVGEDLKNDTIVKVNLNRLNDVVDAIPFQDDAQIYDIAFDPFSSKLYGYSGTDRKLMEIDIENGKIVSDFPRQSNITHVGALFFDSFGVLFGYGSIVGGTGQNILVEFDKTTGIASVVAQGPNSTGNDGCSCPYSISLLKKVSSPTAFPCTTITYDFIISNNSGVSRTGLQFVDELPNGMRIIDVVRNPYQGDMIATDQSITIDNMVIHQGVDSISILVEIDENAQGVYQNQAVLNGLPSFLGNKTLSDDPNTLATLDSTAIEVLSLDLSFINTNHSICKNESVEIDASLYGVEYLWSDGMTDPVHVFTKAGNYSLTVSTACDDINIDIVIDTIGVSVDIIGQEKVIAIGDKVQLVSKVTPDNQPFSIQWTNDARSSISCFDCLSPYVQPYSSTVYEVMVADSFGCTSIDRIYVKVVNDRDIYAPNIFSPNYDGLNDWFSIFTKNGNALVDMSIYDRWGNEVFHKEKMDDNVTSEGWDGTSEGKIVDNGVYTWVATVTYIDGAIILKSGEVTVIY